MTRAISRIVPVALALSLAAPAFAQPRHPKAGAAQRRAQVAERLKRIRGEVLRKRVGLSEQKASTVERILDSHRAEHQRLARELRTQRRAIAALLRKDSNDQAAYARAIQKFRSAEVRQQSLKQREFSQIARVLTPKEQAKLLVALRQMQRRLGRAVRQYRQKHGGARGGTR